MRGFGDLVILFSFLKNNKKNLVKKKKKKKSKNVHTHVLSLLFFFLKFIQSVYSQHTRISDMVHL